MPKKTTILIIILALITGILIFLAVRNDQTQKLAENLNKTTTPTPVVVEPFAVMSFSKPTITVNQTSPQTVDVLIDTMGKPTAGAQIELKYDPKVIRDMKIVPPKEKFYGEFPMVLINNVDPEQGRVSYALGISPNDQEKSGKGTLVTLTFTAVKVPGTTTTQIRFIEKSSVQILSSSESVLKTSQPLNITFSN